MSHSKLGKSDVVTSGAACQQCYSSFLGRQVFVTTEHPPELLPLSPQRVQIGRLKTLTIIIKSNEQNSFDLFFVLFHFLHVCVFVLYKSERYGSGEKIALIAIWPIWYITKSIYRGRTVSRTINQITEGRYHSDTQ